MAVPDSQTITVYRGEDPVIPFAPAAATPAPDAMGFVVAAENEGDPLFDELTVGDGIAFVSQVAGTFNVTLPRVDWADPGDYVWSLFDLDGERELIAAGTLTVRGVARKATA